MSSLFQKSKILFIKTDLLIGGMLLQPLPALQKPAKEIEP